MKISKPNRKRTLSKRILISLLILSIAISISVSALVGVIYYNNQIREYGENAFALATTVANYIDGDRVRVYLDTLEKDDYYDEIMGLMQRIKREFNLLYHYVVAPYEDKAIYLWEGESGDSFGYIEENVTDSDREYIRLILSDNPPRQFDINYTSEWGLCGTAWVPIHDSAGRGVAIVGVDYSMPGIFRMILMFAVIVAAGVVAVMALGGYLYYRSIQKNIIRPVELLNTATGELVSNIDQNVEFHVDIHTGDELETLAESFGKMDQGLRKYIHDLAHVTAEKERIGAELNVATQIQAGMLPRIFPAFPERKEFDIYGTMAPAKEVGGDLYDFFLPDADHLCMVVGDVSGKGVPAALFMVIAKTVIKMQAENCLDPAKVLQKVNVQLAENNEESMFVTVWLGVLEISTGKLTYADAGHEKLLMYQDGKWQFMPKKSGPALAMLDMEDLEMMGDVCLFHNDTIQLKPGDEVFQYTDGVTEATDAHDELFGDERLMDAMNCAPTAKPGELLPHVRRKIDEFVKEADQFDDITMLGLLYKG